MIVPSDEATRRITAARSAQETLAAITDVGASVINNSVPVGMPNGEPANVGPTAAVLGHTPIAWADLSAQVETLVITTAMANAQVETAAFPDWFGVNTTYKVFRKLNVLLACNVATDVPVLITDSRLGMLIVGSGRAKVRSHWNVFTYAPLRAGDARLTANQIWDGADTTAPTTASLNGKTTIGTGANTIGPLGDGWVTDVCYRHANGSGELSDDATGFGRTTEWVPIITDIANGIEVSYKMMDASEPSLTTSWTADAARAYRAVVAIFRGVGNP